MENKEKQIKEWFEKNKEFLFMQATLRVFDLEEMSIKELYTLLCKLIKQYKEDEYTICFRGNAIYITVLLLLIQDKYFHKSFINVYFYLQDTLIKKNSDYGSSFDKSVNKFGWLYVAIELDKKKNRLHSLLKNKEKPNYESIEDTLLDIAGYCVLALIYIEEKYLIRRNKAK